MYKLKTLTFPLKTHVSHTSHSRRRSSPNPSSSPAPVSIQKMSRGAAYGENILKDRFLGFLIWTSIQSTVIFLLSKTLLLSLTPSLTGIFSFLAFQISLILFSIVLSSISSPQPNPAASPFELALGLFRLVFVSGGQPISSDFRRRVRVSASFVMFLAACGLSGYLSVVALCWNYDTFTDGLQLERLVFGPIGFRGFVVGLCYGLVYLYRRRCVLEFPIVQRPPFFSFKKCLPSVIRRALELSAAGYLVSFVLTVAVFYNYKGPVLTGKSVIEQGLFGFGTIVVFICWELSHHLHQVLHTKRVSFAPPKGSAAAETNPSEPLLAALEESIPRSLLQYLAYLDLCMVSEHNVDPWRRAAFFEETGETYKRVLAVCLRPLEQLTLRLGEDIDSCSPEKALQVSHQLKSPTDSLLHEPFYDFQLCTWCARIVSSLTLHSHKEDRFGVAQLSGSNASVISTLLSSLLAVETYMGKKTNLQSPYPVGPANIKWAALNTGRRETTVGVTGKKKGSLQYSKAYAMADVLRTSIYQIVSDFHGEMINGSKVGLLEKDWIVSSKPLYGTRELLLQKLCQFLDFQAC